MTIPELKGVEQDAVDGFDEQSVQAVPVESVLLSGFGSDDMVPVDPVDIVALVLASPVPVLSLVSVQDVSAPVQVLPLGPTVPVPLSVLESMVVWLSLSSVDVSVPLWLV